jgi:hypothetical protein
MIKKIIGIALIAACGACLIYGYTQYMDKTEGARAVDDIAQSTGIANILPEGATKPEVPKETKFAIIGALLTGVSGLVLIVRS